MKNLISHLINNNLAEIVDKSILNCHAIGLHSIMLLDSPGKTIRLYVAEKGNELYKNDKNKFVDGMSIAFHSHHCNLTLVGVKGELTNWEVEKDYTGPIFTDEYLYKSKITTEDICFERTGKEQRFKTKNTKYIIAGNSYFMDANSIHTVSCDQMEVTAWFVFEGNEDEKYKSLCYSTSNLVNGNFDNHYKKPKTTDVIRLLKLCDLI